MAPKGTDFQNCTASWGMSLRDAAFAVMPSLSSVHGFTTHVGMFNRGPCQVLQIQKSGLVVISAIDPRLLFPLVMFGFFAEIIKCIQTLLKNVLIHFWIGGLLDRTGPSGVSPFCLTGPSIVP